MDIALNLPPHPAYKPSGVDWLRDIPAHWEVLNLRSILTSTTERNRPDLPLLSVVREKGVILRDVDNMDENHNFIPEDLTNYKVVHKDQFAMNKMKAWQGSYGVSEFEGIVSPAYFTFDIRGVTGDYFHRAIRSKVYVPFFAQASDGVRIGQWDLSRARMKEIPFALPPLPEQRAIARYLDHINRHIQRYIEAKEKLIALLQEARQSIIQRAVTRGLDPDVPLKPSGVGWLGDVPAHWEMRRAKYLYHEVNERSRTGAEELMSVSHKTGVTPRKKNVTMFRSETNVGYKLCRPGDIVINTMWAYMAALGVARQVGLVSPSYNVYRPIDGEEMNLDYIDALLRTETFRTEYLVRSTGITVSRLRLYPESFLDIPLLYPPEEEQTVIATYLEKATTDIDSAIDIARHQVELMTEYRASLIAHVVTGKLDVRAAAASLSPKSPEQEPVDR